MIYEHNKFNPNIWTSILNAALGDKCLASDLGELTRRGGKFFIPCFFLSRYMFLLAPVPIPPAAPAPPKPVVNAPGTPLHLQHQSIFKPVTQSPTQRFLDEALSSDGSAAQVLVSASETFAKVPTMFLAQVSLFPDSSLEESTNFISRLVK